MIRILIAIAGLTGLLLPVGCRRESNPPPRFIARGNGHAIPVRVYGRVVDCSTGPLRSKSIVAAAPAEDQPPEAVPAPKGGETTKATGAIDDSTPRGALDAFLQAVAGGQPEQVVQLLVPEQQDLVRQVFGAAQPMLDAQAELARAFDERFPGHAIQLNLGNRPSAPFDRLKQLTIVDVKISPDNEAEAEATLQAQGQPAPVSLTLRRIDGHWRIRGPGMPASADELAKMAPMTEVFKKMADVQRDMAARIANDEFADADEANKALGEAMAKAMGMDQLAKAAQEQMSKATVQGAPAGAGEMTDQAQPEVAGAPTATQPEKEEGLEEAEKSGQGPTSRPFDRNAAQNWEVYRGFEALHEELEAVREKGQEKETGKEAERGQLAKDFALRLRLLRRKVAKPELDTAAFHLDAAGEEIYLMAGSIRKPEAYQAAQRKYQEAMQQARAMMGEPPPEHEQPEDQAEQAPGATPRATGAQPKTPAKRPMDRPGQEPPRAAPPPRTPLQPHTPPPPRGARPQQREEVDEVFDSPAMLRNRGS